VLLFAKLGFVVAILWWMTATDKLHLSELAVFVTNPLFLLVAVSFWLVFPVLLGSLRWWVLLCGAGVHAGFLRTVKLQLIGFFFNAAIPGAVGGDLVKAVYVVRDEQGRKTAAMLSILLDRIVGLVGLFTIAFVSTMMHVGELLANPLTRPLVFSLGIASCLVLLFLGFVFFPHRDGRDPVDRLFSRDLPLFPIVHKAYMALRAYREVPVVLLNAWLLSVVLQVAAMTFLWYTTLVVTGQRAALADFTLIFPFGAIATAIPIAPGGLGVGHFAFEKLFTLVGLTGGANAFNVFVLGQLVLNLVGIIPWLSLRAKLPSPTQVQV